MRDDLTDLEEGRACADVKLIAKLRQFYVIALMLICFSYPITTVWLIELGAPVSQVNLVIKAGILFLFLLSLLVVLSHQPRLPRVVLPLLVFLALYGVRLLYDVMILDILMVFQTRTYVFGYFFGLTLVPVVVIALALRPMDITAIHRWTFYFLIAANVSLILYTYLRGPIVAETAFAGRLQEDGVLESTALLNPILVGAVGAMLAVFAIGRLATFGRMSVGTQVFHLVCVFMGGINVLLGASRGPAVALLASIVLVFAGSLGKVGRGTRLQPRTWIYVGLFVIGFSTLVATDVIKLQLIERFELMFDPTYKPEGEERRVIYAMAWSDFLSSPFVGSSYVVRQGAYSPHNILLEALMATGAFGGMAFIAAMALMCRGLWKLIRGFAGPLGVSIGLVATCFFILSMTSGSITGNPEFWAYMVAASLLGHFAARAAVARSPREGEGACGRAVLASG